MRMRYANLVVGLLAALLLTPATRAQSPHDPFAFFADDLTLGTADRAALGRGDVIVHSLSSKGNEIAVLVAIATTATPTQLVTHARNIYQFKSGELVHAVGRISTPATAQDFDALPVSESDLADMRACRPGNCGLKLTAGEIASMRAAMTPGSSTPPGPTTLRRLLAERVQRYQRGGLGDLPSAADGHDEVPPATAFVALLNGHAYLPASMPGLAGFLLGGGTAPPSVADHYLYWSYENTGQKLVASVTDLTIARADTPDLPSVMILGKQVLATHYFTGSLNLLSLAGPANGPRYLVMINRSRVDVLSGPFRGFIRGTIERRVRAAVSGVMTELKRRVEATR